MSTEREMQSRDLTVNFEGEEYNVSVSVSLCISRWEENHGPGLREPWCEVEVEEVEITGGDENLPTSEAFQEAVEDEVKEIDDWT